ncbi:MAG: helix-turn-helix domain-containing protein [Ktedonobacteraceae bacterium]
MKQAFARPNEKVCEPYHYTECGLDDVYLMNGYHQHKTPYGDGVSVEDADALHRVIAIQLCLTRAQLKPNEYRFLRKLMDLTQSELASLLRCDAQTVARWEKDESKAKGSADRLLRLIYLSRVNNKIEVSKIVENLASLDDDHSTQKDVFQKTKQKWKKAA